MIRPPAEEAASLVAARGHQLDVLTEGFNVGARDPLEVQQAAAAAAGAKVAQAEAQLPRLATGLAGVAQTAHAGDGLGALQAFMTTGSPAEFRDRISLLEAVASHHSDVLDQVATARDAADKAHRRWAARSRQGARSGFRPRAAMQR